MVASVKKSSDTRGRAPSSIGRRPIRKDGMDKITGKALYGADVRLPGMLWGKVLRSPHPHARILSIDTSKAEAHNGVKAVITCRDLAPLPVELTKQADSRVLNLKFLHDNILAGEKVLYMGHPVAAVAATSAHVAEEALRLIDVDYELLPAVTNVEDAMRPGAPILHDTLPGSALDTEARQGTNVASYQRVTLGNVEAGFREADVVLEREYRTATVHQGYIEPHTATAWWSPDNRVTIWCSTQAPFEVRDTTAQLVGIPVGYVRVVPLEVGGGFGGKLTSYLEPLAALLSKKSGSPVKMTMGYSEVLAATGPTGGSYMRVKLGATRDGQITAAQAYLALEAGSYPGAFIAGAMGCMFTPYDIPNILIDGYDVVTNKPKTI